MSNFVHRLLYIALAVINSLTEVVLKNVQIINKSLIRRPLVNFVYYMCDAVYHIMGMIDVLKLLHETF